MLFLWTFYSPENSGKNQINGEKMVSTKILSIFNIDNTKKYLLSTKYTY